MSNLLSRRTDLLELHPLVREAVSKTLAKLDAEHIPFRIFEAYRTPQRQHELFQQGRGNHGGRIVTQQDSWGSFHQYGLAADFVLFIEGDWSWDTSGIHAHYWQRLHEIGKEFNLVPVRFEMPHLQIVGYDSDMLKAGKYPARGDATWRDNFEAMRNAWVGNKPPSTIERPPLPSADVTTAPVPAPIFNKSIFFGIIKAKLFKGGFTQAQVNGIDTLLTEWLSNYSQYDDRYLAYIFATVYHETAQRMVPVRETLALTDEQAFLNVYRFCERHGINPNYAAKKNGISYFGRGRVQNTHYQNYLNLQNRFELEFVTNPSLLLNNKIDAKVTIVGHLEGLWTGKKLSDYIMGNVANYVGARHIVNGKDKAEMIANYALTFQNAIAKAYVKVNSRVAMMSNDFQTNNLRAHDMFLMGQGDEDANINMDGVTFNEGEIDPNLIDDTNFNDISFNNAGFNDMSSMSNSIDRSDEIMAAIQALNEKIDNNQATIDNLNLVQRPPFVESNAQNNNTILIDKNSAEVIKEAGGFLTKLFPQNKYLTEVNGALGRIIGVLLDGRKTALGLIGLTAVTLGQVAAPATVTPDPNILTTILSTLGTGSEYSRPILLALLAWGILGKFDKWNNGVRQSRGG